MQYSIGERTCIYFITFWCAFEQYNHALFITLLFLYSRLSLYRHSLSPSPFISLLPFSFSIPVYLFITLLFLHLRLSLYYPSFSPSPFISLSPFIFSISVYLFISLHFLFHPLRFLLFLAHPLGC